MWLVNWYHRNGTETIFWTIANILNELTIRNNILTELYFNQLSNSSELVLTTYFMNQ